MIYCLIIVTPAASVLHAEKVQAIYPTPTNQQHLILKTPFCWRSLPMSELYILKEQ